MLRQRISLLLDDLTIGYTGRCVAGPLSAVLEPGLLTCLLGVNGVGKSTLLRTLAGLQPPLGGSVLVRETSQTGTTQSVDLTTMSRRQRARTVAIVLTGQSDIPRLTVVETVAMGRMPYTGFFGILSPDDRAAVAEALELTSMTDFARRDIRMLSDGERQKVMIAKALAQRTPVVLLDEPTAFLDYPSKVETMKLLRRLAADEGLTVLLSTHDIHLAEAFADRFLTLSTTLAVIPRAGLQQYIKEVER